MKKIFIIVAILSSLIIANILINTENSESKKDIQTLSEAINLVELTLSFEILQKDNKIKLIKKDYCYKIESIDYCADHTKVQLLNKFIGSKVKDTYDDREENLIRLGFDNSKNISSMIINGNKTLFFGNINQYNEIYVLQANKIYKVDYYKGMLEISTKHWIDKSKPIINIVESDEFNIMIHEKNAVDSCASVSHKDLVLDKKFSILRNSFLDLYASDVRLMPLEYLRKVVKNDSLFTGVLKSPHSKKILHKFMIWKEGHLVYFAAENMITSLSLYPNLAFVVPNSVYKNLDIYCKK